MRELVRRSIQGHRAGCGHGERVGEARAQDRCSTCGPEGWVCAVDLLGSAGLACPGEAIHYKQWYGLLTAAEHRVAGKDPVATFLAQVHRAPEVERIGSRTGDTARWHRRAASAHSHQLEGYAGSTAAAWRGTPARSPPRKLRRLQRLATPDEHEGDRRRGPQPGLARTSAAQPASAAGVVGEVSANLASAQRRGMPRSNGPMTGHSIDR